MLAVAPSRTPLRIWIIFLSVFLQFTHSFTTPNLLNNYREYTTYPSPYDAHVNVKSPSPLFLISRRSRRFGVDANKSDEISISEATSLQLQSLFRDDQVNSIREFATRFQLSLLQQKDFESFTLNGPKSPPKWKKTTSEEKRKKIEARRQSLRGSIRQVHARLVGLQNKKRTSVDKKRRSKNIAVADDAIARDIDINIVVQVTVKYHGATDVVQNWELSNSIGQRMIDLIVPAIASSSETTSTTSVISEWGGIVNNSTIAELGFQSGELVTSDGSLILDLATGKGKPKKKLQASCEYVRKVGGNVQDEREQTSLLPQSHDKLKNVLLPPSAQFFQKLGISDAKGNPKIGMSSKLRQCQKFVEVVSSLVNKYDTRTLPMKNTGREQKHENDVSVLKVKPILRTIDMGCGRGYLTFSLHYHLMDRYLKSFDVVTHGIDMRPKLVKEINGIASDLGGKFGQNIHFTEGTIENVMLNDKDTQVESKPQGKLVQNKDIDILIALHACDTATDDSIWYGIQRKSSIIVTAPCCHKEVRRYLDPHVAQLKKLEHPLADMLRHNIYKERIAETVTDSMRALLLEIANYDVQVFEFIGGEHTSKNVMITALKRTKPRSKLEIETLRKRLKALALLHGITRQKLAEWMNEVIGDEKGSEAKVVKSMISSTGMPKIIPKRDAFE